jgi:DNA-binding CsgD family transcriptional regulator
MPDQRSPYASQGSNSALFVVDEQRRILFINELAAELIDKDTQSVEGSPCWEVMALRTLDGKRFCNQECRPWQDACDGNPDTRFHLAYRNPAGSISEIYLRPILLSPPGEGTAALLHVIRPANPATDLQPSETDGSRAEDRQNQMKGHLRDTLTDRETEVLQLLASCHSTADISDKLGISPVTVRNHLQNVMRKLDVHKRLDAVVAWMTGRT